MTHEKELEGYILDGMARAIWVHAYMIWATEVEPPPTMGSGTWEEQASNTPATRKASMQAAKALAGLIKEVNGLGLAELFARVSSQIDTNVAYAFGEEIALLCIGTRDPEDSRFILPPSSRRGKWNPVIPSFHVMLDDDGHALSWDGGLSWERNPSGGTFWSVLVNGQAQWVAGSTSQEALESARAKHGLAARLELGPNGEPVRTGECGEAPKKKTRAAAKTTRTAPILQVTAVPMTIGEFAQAVQGALPSIQEAPGPSGRPGGRWGSDKVFIAAIWRRLQGDPRFHGMTVQQFKKRLVEANRDQLLDLARADSRGDMDESEVIGSEIEDRGATFHFVVDRRARRAGSPSLSIGQFAQAVNEAMPDIPAGRGPDGRPVGRFGDQKVFVAAIWRRLKDDPRFSDMARQAAADRTPVPLVFKKRLVEANRNRLLVLARADLVGAMDPTEVADSEINDRGADFHFVIDPAFGPGY